MQTLLDFLADGGFKLIILAVALVAHLWKRNAEKELREGKPREMPNAMPSQNAMTQRNSTATPQPPATPTPTAAPPPSVPQPPVASKPPVTAKPPVAPKAKTQSDSGSPWSSSTNPFDGKKK